MARLTFSAIGMLALLGAAPAQAQRGPAPPHGETLGAGKTPAQLFASDCAACHRSPAGLAKGRGPGQIANFLMEHYTSSRQSAGLLGAYVASIRAAPPPAAARPQPGAPAPSAAAGPRPPGAVPELEPPGGAVLLQEEPRPGANGRARAGTALSRGQGQPTPAGQLPEARTTVEPEARVETPPSPAPVPKTLDTLEVYD